METRTNRENLKGSRRDWRNLMWLSFLSGFYRMIADPSFGGDFGGETNVNQLRVVNHVVMSDYRGQYLSLSELYELLNEGFSSEALSKSAISKILRKYEEAGLFEEMPSPRDTRVTWWCLTEKARANSVGYLQEIRLLFSDAAAGYFPR